MRGWKRTAKISTFLCLLSTAFGQTNARNTTRHLQTDESKKNVLLLILDDLRWTSVLDPKASGGTWPNTPYLTKLQKESVVFDHAYVNVPWCGPSRSSFLTGREITETKVFSLHEKDGFRLRGGPQASAWDTLPGYFKSRGYNTMVAGKVFHPLQGDEGNPTKSWSKVLLGNLLIQGKGYKIPNCAAGGTSEYVDYQVEWLTGNLNGRSFFSGSTDRNNNNNPYGLLRPFACRGSTPLNLMDDFVVAQAGIDGLVRHFNKKTIHRRPFFMALGFYRPHLPLFVHDLYWSKFNRTLNEIDDPPYLDGVVPSNSMPKAYWLKTESPGLSIAVDGSPRTPPDTVRAYRIAYSAGIAQTDAAIGMVLDKLDELGFSENTVVALASDNGFHIGESGLWQKQLLTEHSTRVPFMFKVPWLSANNKGKGVRVRQVFVELLDLFKTLVDVTGVTGGKALPSAGRSLLPWILDPSLKTDGKAAVSVTPRCNGEQKLSCRNSKDLSYLGFSAREENWRYTVWLRANDLNPRLVTWPTIRRNLPVRTQELYRHEMDVGYWDTEENHNLATSTGVNARELMNVMDRMYEALRKRYDPAYGAT